MTSETDHPRQRTVAELLAEHGDSGATGRRRHRREADGSDAGSPPPEPSSGSDLSAPPDRSMLREPVPPTYAPSPDELRPGGFDAPGGRRRRADVPPPLPPPPVSPPPLSPPVQYAAPPPALPFAPPAPPPSQADHREYATDVMPRITDVPADVTGPMKMQAPPATTADGGPATQLAPVDFDDHPAGMPAGDLDRPDAPGLDGTGDAADLDGADDGDDGATRRRGRGSSEEGAGQGWAVVLAQWVAGALGGALLWVGFRYLWRSFPVVALAAAVLVTVGLVVIVRALLRNNDTRTTVFAVLVGLLLTASPAILVLLGR